MVFKLFLVSVPLSKLDFQFTFTSFFIYFPSWVLNMAGVASFRWFKFISMQLLQLSSPLYWTKGKLFGYLILESFPLLSKLGNHQDICNSQDRPLLCFLLYSPICLELLIEPLSLDCGHRAILCPGQRMSIPVLPPNDFPFWLTSSSFQLGFSFPSGRPNKTWMARFT